MRSVASKRRIARCKEGGLYVFCRIYFPHLLYKKGDNLIHQELCNRIDHNMRDRGRLLGLMPRGHAKTTYGTVGAAIREICLDRGKDHILIIGATEEEVRSRMDSIIQELEHNDMLKEDYGLGIMPMRRSGGQAVSNKITDLQCANGTRIRGRPFLSKLRGVTSKGKRLKLVLMDDPENHVDVKSKKKRMEGIKWITEDLIPAMDVEVASLQWLGTLLHHDSLLQWFLNNRPTWDKLDPAFKQAATNWPMDEHDTCLWPEMYSQEKLVLIEEDIGREAFMQEYFNQPYNDLTQVYRPEDWRWFDLDRVYWLNGHPYLRYPELPDSKSKRLTIYLSVDPSIGIDKKHDYTGMLVAGVPLGTKDVYYLDIRRLKMNPVDLVDAIVNAQHRWRPFHTGIESVQYQTMLTLQVIDKGFRAMAIKPSGPKKERLHAASVPVAQGRIYLPLEHRGSDELVEEGKYFPDGANDDLLDAHAQMIVMIDFGAANTGCVAGKRRMANYTMLNLRDDYDSEPGRRRVSRR